VAITRSLTRSQGSTMGSILRLIAMGEGGSAGTLTITQIAQRLIDGDQTGSITLHKGIHPELV